MIRVLVSTIDNNSPFDLIETMNLKGIPTIIVSQSRHSNQDDTVEIVNENKLLHSSKVGLSNSRNSAIELADPSDICQIADDDMVFSKDYVEMVNNAFEEFKDADIMIFHVEGNGRSKLDKGRVGYIKSMKTSSVQICFRKESIDRVGIRFDNRFGIGAENHSGEENIFLFDALKRGLKIYYYPVTIAKLTPRESGWDRNSQIKNANIRGKVFKRMTRVFYPILILQFAIRKHKIYKNEISMFTNIKEMFKGAKNFKS